jgi:type IV pilus assembly protein PilY1
MLYTLTSNDISWYGGAATENDGTVKKWGWYFDFVNPGERVVNPSIIYGNGVLISSTIPSDDPCTPGLRGVRYIINGKTGGKTNYTVWDLNTDGVINTTDDLNGNIISGYETTGGGIAIAQGQVIGSSGAAIGISPGKTGGRKTWTPMSADTD